jgi:hypothetical protein
VRVEPVCPVVTPFWRRSLFAFALCRCPAASHSIRERGPYTIYVAGPLMRSTYLTRVPHCVCMRRVCCCVHACATLSRCMKPAFILLENEVSKCLSRSIAVTHSHCAAVSSLDHTKSLGSCAALPVGMSDLFMSVAVRWHVLFDKLIHFETKEMCDCDWQFSFLSNQEFLESTIDVHLTQVPTWCTCLETVSTIYW